MLRWDLSVAILGGGLIWWLKRRLRPQPSRTQAIRELFLREAAAMTASQAKGPVWRWRRLDPKHVMTGKYAPSGWDAHRARVQARLKKGSMV